MERRDFFKKAAIGTAGTGLVAAGCGSETTEGQGAPAVITQPRLRWRLVSSFPRSLDTIYQAAETFAERVGALTEGRFEIRVYPAGEIVPFDQVLETVQKGSVQLGHTASYYFKGLNPALAFDATVPFGLTARQHQAWLLHGGAMTLFRNLFADFNIVNFMGGNTGTQMGGWFKNEINSLADMRGLKMRIPGLGGEVMEALGISTQQIAGGETYQALEQGTIDALEWVGPYDDEKLGFYQIARNYYYPGWWEPGPGLSFYINKDSWDSLPATYQDVIQSASMEAHLTMQSSYDQKNPPALSRLIEKGVQLRPFPEDMMREAERISFEIMEQSAASDAAYNEIYQSFKTFREDAYRWFSTAENRYASFAFNPFNPGT